MEAQTSARYWLQMALIRHITGIPTETEQRCVRCCEVIINDGDEKRPFWPGKAFMQERGVAYAIDKHIDAIDCTPHDPHAVEDLKDVLGEGLEEMDRLLVERFR